MNYMVSKMILNKLGDKNIKKIILLFIIILLFQINNVCAMKILYVDNDINYNNNKVTNFTSISTGIHAASEGDTIFIFPGTYVENIIIDKQLNIYGVNVNGEEPIVNGGGNGSVFTLNADGILINGIEIINSGNKSNDAGIKVKSNYNTIKYNNFSNNNIGILIISSNYNEINNNILIHNKKYGIAILGKETDIAIKNIIENNTAFNNSESGILLDFSNYCNLTKNNVSNNKFGIWLVSSKKNNIIGNNILKNYKSGIILYQTDDNTIVGNNIIQNDYGIISIKNNTIYLNNFINNNQNIFDAHSTNKWVSTEKILYEYNNSKYSNYLGNYYWDYFGFDFDEDGIGSSPYIINSNQDGYPLVNPTLKYIIPSITMIFRPIPSISNTSVSIYISSNPSGANIYIDGIYKGETPKMISNVSIGRHTLKLTKIFHKIYSNNTIIYQNNNPIQINLKPSSISHVNTLTFILVSLFLILIIIYKKS